MKMKRGNKGFTLVELMIVVAIIGILAAIAIPNFLRYQLRTKASERRINLEAIFKAEESLRQSERVVVAGQSPGQYLSFGPIPTGTLGAAKMPWAPADLAAAQQIDWMVQGSTYAKYQAAVAGTNANVAVSMCAWSDIDADTIFGGDAMWNPQIDANGNPSTNAPAAPCDAATDVAAHASGFDWAGTDSMGRPVQLSADSIF